MTGLTRAALAGLGAVIGGLMVAGWLVSLPFTQAAAALVPLQKNLAKALARQATRGAR